MKLKKYLYILLAVIIALSAIDSSEAYAARKKRTKSRTSKTYKSKQKSKYSKSSKKYSRKKTYRIPVKAATPPPPPDPVLEDTLTMYVNEQVINWVPKALNPGGLRVNSVVPDSLCKTAKIGLNEHFTYLPVTKEIIDSLSNHIKSILPDSIADYKVSLTVKSKPLTYYINRIDKLPEKYRKNPAFVSEMHPWGKADKGMENDIIALWHSHGRYFKPGSGSWMWQRPFLFQEIEDTYTMSYVLPYVVPMLENAGAYVMLPRERDVNRHEVIVDNDINPEGAIYSQPYYKEKSGSKQWSTGEFDGFIYDLADFRDTENPFENGTYRQVETQRGNNNPSIAAWCANIPEDGEYAVYISYKTLPNSTKDARYTVNYSGGTKEFKVNQTMGGGTWIYLGTFPLKKGYSDNIPVVTLTNISDSSEPKVVTADAVKIGGGMGNIARSNHRSDIYYDPSTPDTDSEADGDEDDGEGDDETSETTENTASTDTSVPAEPLNNSMVPRTAPVFCTSGLPRFLEGARYWLHWAGVPETVYSPYHGTDDYKDDYTCRGHWVNYLAGGSRVLPDQDGLGIPVDLSLALHSDAGKRPDDSIIGTLGIYYTQNGATYTDGTPRINSRMLTDLVMRQICNDIRREHEPNWTRRSMWDKSYLEARVAEVPTTLIELLSHQNFGDMRLGVDPDFRFTVGRAIYKGLARFLAERKNRELVIQPLPVSDFAIHRIKKNHYKLSWSPTPDPLEPTAMPEKYVILERSEGELGFHKIAETSSNHYEFKTADSKIHSFKVVALNRGGKSFPSEVLALRESETNKKPLLIINGFTRVSAPGSFADAARAGFDTEHDFGVPYIRDISFTGYQQEFNRAAGDGFGRSATNYVGHIIAGNTFDFPFTHGIAMANAGEGFVSASAGAVEKGDVKLSDFHIVDYILGKQKTTTYKGKSKYRTFSPEMQAELRKYSDNGGKMIVSGQYVASDLLNTTNNRDSIFASDVLGVALLTDAPQQKSGRVIDSKGRTYNYSNTLNEKVYIVEMPDVLTPTEGANATSLLKFSDCEGDAGFIVNRGKGKNAVLSIPIESLSSQDDRNHMMKTLLDNLR